MWWCGHQPLAQVGTVVSCLVDAPAESTQGGSMIGPLSEILAVLSWTTLLPTILSGMLAALLARFIRDRRQNIGEELRQSADKQLAEAVKALDEAKQRSESSGAAANSSRVDENDDSIRFDPDQLTKLLVAKAAESNSRDTNLYTRYADEAVFRSKVSYWIALSIGILGVLVILSGVALSLFAKLDVAIVAGVVGALETSIGALLYRRSDSADKRAGEWFEKASSNLDNSDSLQRALGIAETISDSTMKDRIRALAGLGQLFPGEEVAVLLSALGNSEKG
ncbi:hypothetical protein SAMN05216553_102474 [Lentzea fradiae]|uniref:Cyanobacterial TRADD-N associated 2 transmembrane domain-containing protein n=2 Tax=Lentzea fradiae TaxID=200378 RepID=A0A1G7MS45_9PSEU|nr:hypothetical protein SAMN05216553_102474 [Lentzea fradiae]